MLAGQLQGRVQPRLRLRKQLLEHERVLRLENIEHCPMVGKHGHGPTGRWEVEMNAHARSVARGDNRCAWQ